MAFDRSDDTSQQLIATRGLIIRLARIPGESPSDTRSEFVRHCRFSGITVGQTPHPETGELRYGCEFAWTGFSKRTGKPHGDAREVATAYHVTGPVDRLLALIEQPFIGEFHIALPARMIGAQGQVKKPGSHSQDKHN